ncbi:MAG: hypothetical protein GX359_11305 [Clostridiales bacterium]|nr:hypothetical protein [Clostridiales bacterium]
MDLLPSKEELDKKYHPSDELNRRIKRIIIRNRMDQKVHAYAKSARKIAVIIIILFTASSITLLSVGATRNAIFNLIIEHHDKYTEIRFDESAADGTNSNFNLKNSSTLILYYVYIILQ